jgi:hypothetical protein
MRPRTLMLRTVSVGGLLSGVGLMVMRRLGFICLPFMNLAFSSARLERPPGSGLWEQAS